MKGRKIDEQVTVDAAASASVVSNVLELLGKRKAAGPSGIAYGCRWCRKAFRTTTDRAEHEGDAHTYKRREKEAVES